MYSANFVSVMSCRLYRAKKTLYSIVAYRIGQTVTFAERSHTPECPFEQWTGASSSSMGGSWCHVVDVAGACLTDSVWRGHLGVWGRSVVRHATRHAKA